MVIKKFLHSCILIESKGQKLLIDPGSFCFIEGKLKPEDLTPVDIILLTHEHFDHYAPDALEKILAVRKAKIITNDHLHKLLKEKGVESTIIAPGETQKVGAFSINAFTAPHGPAIGSVPNNIGFFVNDIFLHPGDSLDFTPKQPIKVFSFPFAASWLIMQHALDFVIKIKPEIAIPIHDVYVKDFLLNRFYPLAEKQLAEAGIRFKPLALNESLEIPD